MPEIGIGIVGGGYMGKAHAVALRAVAALFGTALQPRLEMVAATTEASANAYQQSFGFSRGTSDWQSLVADDQVEAVVIASPQDTHRDIAEACFAAGKHVLCEKPLSASLEESRSMVAAAEASGLVNMVGFNYFGTPATQFARQLVAAGEIGKLVWFRGEHTEDFFSDPDEPATWRSQGVANGAMGDLAPHMVQAALGFMGPVEALIADVETVHTSRIERNGLQPVTNDDQGQMMCRFQSGTMGHLFFSRISTGRKMGYAYEITGDKGAIRFDQEDQNALLLYRAEGPKAERGFKKILSGPEHPDYSPFCQGPGHGTGYQDQIIIEASHFLNAIAEGKPATPNFRDGLDVHRVICAAHDSSQRKAWTHLRDY